MSHSGTVFSSSTTAHVIVSLIMVFDRPKHVRALIERLPFIAVNML
jgi:hypothetical protein